MYVLQTESLTGEVQSVSEQLATVSSEKLMLVSSTCNSLDLLILLVMKSDKNTIFFTSDIEN